MSDNCLLGEDNHQAFNSRPRSLYLFADPLGVRRLCLLSHPALCATLDLIRAGV